MSNPVSNFVSSASSPKSPGIEALMASSGSEALPSDAQAFARWMAQHREAQVPASALTASPQAASPKASLAMIASANRNTGAQVAPPHPAHTAQVTAGATEAAAVEARTDANRTPSTKSASSRPAQKSPNAPKDANRPRAPEAESTAEAAGPREVSFKTAQGEASAWVQELQPPPELSTSDPAAMMAWLASLTQADAATPGTTATVQAGSPADAAQAGRAGPAIGGLSMRAGHDALADASRLAQQQAQMESAALEIAQGQVAEVVQETSAEAPVALDFGALMARESVRAAADRTGVEAPRHYTGSLAAPVDSADFAQALVDRVGLWVSGPALNGPMTAELRLNPAEMGPVQIRIELDGTQAQIDFVAAQPETRQAIESSLSLLSGSLEEAGLQLAGGGVSDQSQGRQAFQAGDGASGGQGNPWRAAQPEPEGDRLSVNAAALVPAGTPGRSAGLGNGLDLYA